MSDEEFWAIVESLGPLLRHRDRSETRAALVRHLSPLQAEGLWWQFRWKTLQLDQAVREAEARKQVPFPLSGVPRNDVLAHVVGLGEFDFRAALWVPEILWSRAKRLEFLDHYLEGLPCSSDYPYPGLP